MSQKTLSNFMVEKTEKENPEITKEESEQMKFEQILKE